ncbi:MAG: isopentenyl phosphate kinase [Candidatus Heimdallarchaeaceae archaeon]
MVSKKIDIIKIGGSVITNKRKYKTLIIKNLARIIEEIAKSPDKPKILIHGAGSFGHIVAKKYNIINGFKKLEQIDGILKIREDMAELTKKVVNFINKKNLKALAFQTSAITFENQETKVVEIYVEPIKKALEINLIPVLSGDIVFSDRRGFSIISGDQLIELLTSFFDVEKVVFCSDIDGLMGYNKKNEQMLIEEIEYNKLDSINIAKIKETEKIDVTGEMQNKLNIIKKLSGKVHEVVLVNGLIEGRLRSVLNNEKTICTKIINK